ncbi:hypothetical protein AMTR_s00070p00081510 [Amborella trichopoda]|uniref:WASH complex subunit 7 C-terminal domain-containing protein n=1 Tax=Amborella trichopoda TaxID=13333 RepID=U5DDH9_AMBTC|nr:hypothetical protein AMTR_s00070p00081510 [Amborella trichopoda]
MLDHKYSLSDHANYLSILDNALFKGPPGSEKAHLKQFFLILPALTINVVDCKIHYKDKVLRRRRDAANQTPSDDGFMLGIAYILKVLDTIKRYRMKMELIEFGINAARTILY